VSQGRVVPVSNAKLIEWGTFLAMGFRRTGSSVYKGVPLGHLSGSDARRSFLRPVRPRLPLLFPLDPV
jgi:hypothetical protein